MPPVRHVVNDSADYPFPFCWEVSPVDENGFRLAPIAVFETRADAELFAAARYTLQAYQNVSGAQLPKNRYVPGGGGGVSDLFEVDSE